MAITKHKPLEDYAQSVRRFSFRHPNVILIMTQVIFWVPANVFYLLITTLAIQGYTAAYPQIGFIPLVPQLLLAIGVGLLYGGMLGTIDIIVDRRARTQRSLGAKILLKSALYTLAFGVAITAAVIIWEELLLKRVFVDSGIPIDPRSRTLFVSSVAIYTLTGNFLISFIKQVNLRFGPGVLIPLLLGRYREPVEENRIVMFLDLRSSTTYAEKLGHIRFSKLIQDVFMVVNQQVPKFDAEIYQYVGDEVIFTWKIGEIKRDIAHHGDTMNTTARIQGQANELGHDLLVSAELAEACGLDNVGNIRMIPLGSIQLKGKQESVSIYGVERA